MKIDRIEYAFFRTRYIDRIDNVRLQDLKTRLEELEIHLLFIDSDASSFEFKEDQDFLLYRCVAFLFKDSVVVRIKTLSDVFKVVRVLGDLGFCYGCDVECITEMDIVEIEEKKILFVTLNTESG